MPDPHQQAIVNSSGTNASPLSKRQALDIPEITALVVAHLNDEDDESGYLRAIWSSCLVSKAFYHAFHPFIWTDLNLPYGRNHRLPSINDLQANAHHVRSLSLTWNRRHCWSLPDEFTTVVFPHLRKITLLDKEWWRSSKSWKPFLQECLLRYHANLQELRLERVEYTSPSTQLYEESPTICAVFSNIVVSGAGRLGTAFGRLRKLELVAVICCTEKDVSTFLDLCTLESLQELILCHCDVWSGLQSTLYQEWDDDEDQRDLLLQFEQQKDQENNSNRNSRHHSQLRRLSIKDNYFDIQTFKHMVILAARSPHLKSLAWSHLKNAPSDPSMMINSHYDIGPLAQVVEENPQLWPNLTSLDLEWCDSNLDSVLESLSRGLETLSLVTSALGPSSISTLFLHAATLLHLNLSECPYVTSAIMNTILCASPCLCSVTGPDLLTSDLILKDDKEDQKEWVCRDLKEWDLGIRMDVADPEGHHHRHVLARLARLDKIKTINFYTKHGRWQNNPTLGWNSIEGPPPLRLQIGLGLEQLQTLRDLRVLKHPKPFSLGDLKWILMTFPRLKAVKGGLIGFEDLFWRKDYRHPLQEMYPHVKFLP